MKASVIIPVWNGRQYLPDCLDALLDQSYPDFEVIVVDNASGDGSADLVVDRYPRVRLIRNDTNLGFSGGCNSGLREAQGDILVLLNQDAVVRPGWLDALAEALRDEATGVVGCKAFYPDGETIQHAGGWIEWPLGLVHHHGRGEPDGKRWSEPGPVEYVTGAGIAFRRSVLENVGKLDEGFWPGYFEDVDFCMRVRQAGYQVWYEPRAEMFHLETTSLSNPERISEIYQRGRLRLVLKHLSPDRFLEEFVPAERAYQGPAVRGRESVALRLAYLEAIPMAARLLPRIWQVDEGTFSQVVLALEGLHRAVWREDWDSTEESVPLGVESPHERPEVGSVPTLGEIEFRSGVPIVGPLIARARALWYSIAARWAVRALIEQQDRINRMQATYLRALNERVTVLARENSALSREVADLILEKLE